MPESLRTSTIHSPHAVVNSFEGIATPQRDDGQVAPALHPVPQSRFFAACGLRGTCRPSSAADRARPLRSRRARQAGLQEPGKMGKTRLSVKVASTSPLFSSQVGIGQAQTRGIFSKSLVTIRRPAVGRAGKTLRGRAAVPREIAEGNAFHRGGTCTVRAKELAVLWRC